MTIRVFLSKLKRLHLKIFKKFLYFIRLPRDAKIGRLAQRDLVLRIDTGRLLLKQSYDKDSLMTESIFNVIIRYLTIEELFEKKNCGMSMSNKRRSGFKSCFMKDKSENVESLKEFSLKVSKNGFSADDFVAIDKNQKILYGHNLLANALYFDIREIPVRITSVPLKERVRERVCRNIDKDTEGIDKEKFSSEEIKIIEETKDEIFFNFGLYFPGVLWGPVSDYFDEITERLSKKHKVIFFKDYTFKNEDDFYEMLEKLYSWEAIGQDIIKIKFDYLIEHPLIIRFFSILICEPIFKISDNKKIVFSSVVKDMKEEYRRIYSKKIENYIRDVVLHIGDNFQHNKHILNVFEGIKASDTK